MNRRNFIITSTISSICLINKAHALPLNLFKSSEEQFVDELMTMHVYDSAGIICSLEDKYDNITILESLVKKYPKFLTYLKSKRPAIQARKESGYPKMCAYGYLNRESLSNLSDSLLKKYSLSYKL